VKKINWGEVLEKAKVEAERFYSEYGMEPSVRKLFYILYSLGLLPNTRSAWVEFSRRLASARYFGEFPWWLVRDGGGRKILWGDLGQSVEDAERVLQEVEKVKSLSEEEKHKILEEYFREKYRVTIRKWEGQPHRVLVIVEKEASFYDIDTIVNRHLSWDVSVAFARGFESATYAKMIADWISDLKAKNITPVLLFCYDFDPSGEYASIRDLAFRVLALVVAREGADVAKLFKRWERAKKDDEKLEILNELTEKTGVKWEKVILTWEQVRKYNLPHTPEFEDVIKKLQRDSRKKWFKEIYGGLYQAEIEALIALQERKVVTEILDSAIRKYFDEEVYQQVKAKEEELRRKVEEKLGF